ncbi:MAG: hypothetical protein LM561_04230 [Desulfurococcaceae archaeon]|nr:hypothetical protein [Desulfurococcaceae archaeon]
MKVKVYYCVEHGSGAVIPRHHVAPYSVCEDVDLVELDHVRSLLPAQIIDHLIKKGEVRVSDIELVEKLSGKRVENSYVKLIMLPK